MSVKKYAVFPGWVRSKTDGDQHWIGARRIMELYGVSEQDCVVVDPRVAMAGRADVRGLVPLYPRTDGRYALPT